MTGTGTPLTYKDFASCRMDGVAIRNLGIQRFLDTCKSTPFGNIDMLATTQQLEKRWHECNMGCHDPDYRVVHRQATFSELINNLSKIDPTKGLATGVFEGTVTTTDKIVKGVERTGEGLGLAGSQRITEIGIENSLAFNLAKDVLEKAYTLSIDLVDNPITATVIQIVTYYFRYIPDEIVVQMAAYGKFKNISVDINMSVQASLKGLTSVDLRNFTTSELKKVGDYLQNNPQMLLKMVGKSQGKKLATYIATHIAIFIAKKIAKGILSTRRYRNIKLLAQGKNAKGLAGVLVFLLKTQGLLEIASDASHRLHSRAPKLWQKLRSMHGLDMIYFMVEDFLHEYVDRIGLAERDPAGFIAMVAAILQPPGSAKDLFLPFRSIR